MKSALRSTVLSLGLIVGSAVPFSRPGQAQEKTAGAAAAGFEIAGVVKNGKIALPGVTVTAANTLSGKKVSVVTGLDGSFKIAGLARGRYVVKVEFMGFAAVTQEVVLNQENPAGKADVELILASRQQEEQTREASAARAASRGFQNLTVEGNLGGLSEGDNGNGTVSASDLASLPMNGAGVDVATESFSISGAQGRSQDFGSGTEEELQQRIQEFRDRAQREGTGFGGFPIGPGGGIGGPAGPGGPMIMGRLGRGFNVNQPHGFLYFQDEDSAFDAEAYSLTGQETPKASYNQMKFGAFVGGPLKIPGLLDWSKSTFYSVGWNGTRGSTPYNAYSTVPTEAERNGNFSGLTDKNGNLIPIYDPTTGQPFPNNTIDPNRFSSAAASLLAYIPLPNLPGATQNYHYVTADESNTDTFSLRLIHNFSGTGGPLFGPGRGGGGPGGPRGPRNNLNLSFNWSRANTEIVNPFPSLAGSTDTQGWNASLRWIYGKGPWTNTVGLTYNHNRVATTNLYSETTDVAGNAGITGISANPFDWGLPGISFTSYSGFSGPVPSQELDQTYTITDLVLWHRGKHSVRFGGDYRWILQAFRSARNGEGTFVFTGFATAEYQPGSTQAVPGTGNDFADFLLGLPQQTSLQSGTSSYNFSAHSLDGFVQDDWRILPNFSVNAGLRYEYNGPFTEASNHIANLDVSFNPENTTAYLVLPGQTGPYSGIFPYSLVRPDHGDFAPRIGLAWRIRKNNVIRAGYGINYNLAQYTTFVQNFAFQPPFATTATNVSTYGDFLTLENGFPPTTATPVTNNYALDPNYRLAYVQIWNLDIQRQLPGNIQLNIGYNGAKGTRLDTQRALVPTCSSSDCQSSLLQAVSPFIYESSEGNSTLNAGSIRIRKRFSKGLGLSASYVFSKSLDNASSIGGGTVVVAQNPFDISADRGLSSFDQQQVLTGSWIYDLPFGDGRRFLNHGWISPVTSGWQWSGSFTIASGFYYTPRVLGATVDIDRGVSGSLRANWVPGQSMAIAHPSTAEWFNTAAFCAPGPGCEGPTGSIYGDAGRNIIEGPWQYTFNMTLSRTITIRESRSLDLRVQANNIFNTPYFSSINTVVNSSTYGQVTAVSNMRQVTLIARFRF